MGLGLILLIIPGIIFMVWYYFSSYVNVLEVNKNNGLEALTSSKELVKGRWFKTLWRLIAPYLAIYLPVTILELIVVGILYVILSALNADENLYFYIVTPFNIIFNFVGLCLLPLYLSFTIILYNNLKETKKPIIQ